MKRSYSRCINKNGKIAGIGNSLFDATATVIDAKGKHLTSGIIDEHSHIAISNGVNESGHNSSAEVTVEDVVNSEDINIYRDLAGGVTTTVASWFCKPNRRQISNCNGNGALAQKKCFIKTNLNLSSLP
jgi:cytosine/adenosine deaminase-related metal-dependent hydrolase